MWKALPIAQLLSFRTLEPQTSSGREQHLEQKSWSAWVENRLSPKWFRIETKKSLFREKSRNETEISSHGCHSRTIYDRPHTPLVLWSTMTTTTTTTITTSTSTTTMATTKPNNASFALPGAKQMADPKPRPNISKQAWQSHKKSKLTPCKLAQWASSRVLEVTIRGSNPSWRTSPERKQARTW